MIVAYCGENVKIEHGAHFTLGLSIGDRSGVGFNCELNGSITIGRDVMIYTSGHEFGATDIPMMNQGSTAAKPVIIGDDVLDRPQSNHYARCYHW